MIILLDNNVFSSVYEHLKLKETGRTVEYEYDELYRLVKETVTDHSGTAVTEYTYDRNSNRLTKTVDGEEYRYDYAGNRIAKIGELSAASFHRYFLSSLLLGHNKCNE